MTFDDFLQDKHMEENPTVLDDDLPDHFADWEAELSEGELAEFKREFKIAKYYLNK